MKGVGAGKIIVAATAIAALHRYNVRRFNEFCREGGICEAKPSARVGSLDLATRRSVSFHALARGSGQDRRLGGRTQGCEGRSCGGRREEQRPCRGPRQSARRSPPRGAEDD